MHRMLQCRATGAPFIWRAVLLRLRPKLCETPATGKHLKVSHVFTYSLHDDNATLIYFPYHGDGRTAGLKGMMSLCVVAYPRVAAWGVSTIQDREVSGFSADMGVIDNADLLLAF